MTSRNERRTGKPDAKKTAGHKGPKNLKANNASFKSAQKPQSNKRGKR